ncbi:MAG: DUF4983 domain-containing protein [Flavobacteriales bacterium]|nr:MAG: DUF4983 domain-containing protein [Flavobacteriales bacterium]
METMRKNIRKYNRARVFGSSLLTMVCCLGAMSLTSCNKDFESLTTNKYNNDSLAVSAGTKKVLYIILDGVRGSVLSTMKPVNVVKINKNATYTFSGLNDSTTTAPTNAGGWTDMITGAPVKSHKVISEDFAGNQLAQFPTVFTRLKQVNPNLKTVSLAASASFDSNLATDASEHAVFNSDAEVQTALKAKIGTTQADLIVAQFHSADVAGAAGGYNIGNTSYTTAITTLDGYLGEALIALKARPTYSDENWLVIIASNKGGTDASTPISDATLFGDPTKNTYVAMYNPAFDTKNYNKPNTSEIAYSGKAPRFKSTATTTVYATLANTAVGNFGTTGNFTLMFKFRDDYTQASYYPMFLGKRGPIFNSVASTSIGWGFLFGENSAQLDWRGTPRPGFNVDIRDASWHTVAFTISTVGSTRTLALFVDGVKRNSNTITSNPDNAIPLRIGAEAGAGSDQADFLLTDLAIFNTAIPDNDLTNYMKREINASNPYFANLIGWWPCNEGDGTLLKDRSGKGNDFSITGIPIWTSFSDLSPNINPSISGVVYRTVPNGVDLPFTIYNWFKVLPPTSWGLSGRSFSPVYLSLSTN